MPTTRTRRARPRVGAGSWVTRYLRDGIEPAENDPAYDEYFGWAWCGETIAGLPRVVDQAGVEELKRLKRAARRGRR